jgi:uncharacterized protein (DUF433 family)
MTDEELLSRIAIDPAVMAGKPVIKGTRLTVEFIVNLLAHGSSNDEILGEYAHLTSEDIQACLLYAGRALDPIAVLPLSAEMQ